MIQILISKMKGKKRCADKLEKVIRPQKGPFFSPAEHSHLATGAVHGTAGYFGV